MLLSQEQYWFPLTHPRNEMKLICELYIKTIYFCSFTYSHIFDCRWDLDRAFVGGGVFKTIVAFQTYVSRVVTSKRVELELQVELKNISRPWNKSDYQKNLNKCFVESFFPFTIKSIFLVVPFNIKPDSWKLILKRNMSPNVWVSPLTFVQEMHSSFCKLSIHDFYWLSMQGRGRATVSPSFKAM